MVHRLIWPEEESPDTYYMKNRYQEGFQRQISLDAGARFKAGAYLVAAEVRTPKLSYGHLLDFAWEVNYHRQKPWYSPEELWRLGLHYAKHSLYVEEGIYRGFSKGLRWNGAEWRLRPTARYLAGWTGQNISLANSMIHSYIMSGSEEDPDRPQHFADMGCPCPLGQWTDLCLFDPILTEARRMLSRMPATFGCGRNFFEAWELLGRSGLKTRGTVQRNSLGHLRLCPVTSFRRQVGKLGTMPANVSIPTAPVAVTWSCPC